MKTLQKAVEIDIGASRLLREVIVDLSTLNVSNQVAKLSRQKILLFLPLFGIFLRLLQRIRFWTDIQNNYKLILNKMNLRIFYVFLMYIHTNVRIIIISN